MSDPDFDMAFKNGDSETLEDFEKIKAELRKVQARQNGIIAETFHQKNVDDIEFSQKNYDALRRIYAYELRKQRYFSKWLKSQHARHAKLVEDYKASVLPEQDAQQPVFLILTVDLTGARPWALAKIERALAGIGFEKYPTSRMKAQKDIGFPEFGASANIYAAEVYVDENMGIDADRDRINEKIRELMDQEREKGQIEEYRYILFVSRQWSWQAGGTR